MTELSNQKYRAIGLMSGSSLDGLDIALCEFDYVDDQWRFEILETECVSYSEEWVDRLRNAIQLDGKALWQLHADFGHFSGQAVADFIRKNDIKDVTLVSSHGHTVFHYPDLGFTIQIGDGNAIAAESGLPVVYDFRSIDVAKGGQGAPLVPIGDKLLFKDYKFLLNIGGIANVTVQQNDKTTAFDICSANQVLNYFAQQRGMDYDAEGKMAASGRLNEDLVERLNALDYYAAAYPKSLDNGYSRDVLLPMLDQSNLAVEDRLHNYCEHIAIQIAAHLKEFNPTPQDRMLVTGGGALNDYLMTRIRHHLPVTIEQPGENLVQFKEALVFAFMGVLRWRGMTNIYKNVTGASSDSVAGVVCLL